MLSAPIAMFIPVIALYLGLEFKAKVVGVVLFTVFIIIVNTAAGIREVPASGIEAARAFETSRRRLYTRIIFPWASPFIITGLRLAVGRAVEGAILFELFLRAENLGLLIKNAAGSFDLSQASGRGLLYHDHRGGLDGACAYCRVAFNALEERLAKCLPER